MLNGYLPFVLKGLIATVEITFAGMLVAIPTAFVLGLARLNQHRMVRLLAGVIIEPIRGSSALVQLFIAYYVLPELGIDISAFLTAVLVLGINLGCFDSEYVRGAFSVIPRGQTEAATVVGLPHHVTFLRILLPQAIPALATQLGNALIDMVKFTSLVSTITVSDITFRGLEVRTVIGHSGEIFGLLLVVYFGAALLMSALSWGLEVLAYRRFQPSSSPPGRGFRALRKASRAGPTVSLSTSERPTS